MVDWAKLQDVYGSAEQVPTLLADAERGDETAWHDLWSRLCHQGTVSTASFAALPQLAAMAQRHPDAGYIPPLALAASIISASDRDPGFDDSRDKYANELAALRSVAERSISVAEEFGDFVYAVQFLMAFEGVPIWQDHLQSLADEELQLSCPNCDAYLYADLGDPDFNTRLATDPQTGESARIAPAEPARLPRIEARIYRIATERGQLRAADNLLYLFGESRCPNCNQTFVIPQALAAEDPARS